MRINQASLSILPLLATFLLSFILRGYFKAKAAYYLGDSTAKDYGFLTLNPSVHIDAIGTVIAVFFITAMMLLGWGPDAMSIVLLALLFMFGSNWRIEAPINSYNFSEKNRVKYLAIISSCGILAYFVLSLISLYVYRLVFLAPFFSEKIKYGTMFFANIIAFFSVSLGVFYLIPVPFPYPMPQRDDGFLIFSYLFPNAARYCEENITPQSLLIILFLLISLWSLPIISLPFNLLRYIILKLIKCLVFI
jgi:hypothetical protein